tara:strand:- start:233 stop:379 length:147 start_codon:yes stop_codon:yes gene_type:complete
LNYFSEGIIPKSQRNALEAIEQCPMDNLAKLQGIEAKSKENNNIAIFV